MKNSSLLKNTLRLINRNLVNGLVVLSLVGVMAGAPAVSAAPKLDKPVVEKRLSVSINKASVQELAEKLVGVGESKAKAIIAWRESNGKFKSIDQLVEVKGIGAKTLEKNRAHITL